jgi:hypothetical protein
MALPACCGEISCRPAQGKHVVGVLGKSLTAEFDPVCDTCEDSRFVFKRRVRFEVKQQFRAAFCAGMLSEKQNA